jgi:hypothetical protein
MKTIKLLSITALLATASLLNCTKKEATPSEFYGESMSLGNGTAKTFYRVDDVGNPSEIGIAISETAMNSLPHATNSTSLKLPTEAEGKTPFTFVLFDYNHLGHEPTHVYDVPHFDVHFYMTSDAERLKINPADKGVDAAPADGYLPMPRIGAGVVPQMGNHWIDVTSPELNGSKFTNTFIYGSAYGKVTFYEPMITTDFVKNSAHSHFPIKQPQKFEKSGYYPTEYCVRFNADAKQYEVTIESFQMK